MSNLWGVNIHSSNEMWFGTTSSPCPSHETKIHHKLLGHGSKQGTVTWLNGNNGDDKRREVIWLTNPIHWKLTYHTVGVHSQLSCAVRDDWLHVGPLSASPPNRVVLIIWLKQMVCLRYVWSPDPLALILRVSETQQVELNTVLPKDFGAFDDGGRKTQSNMTVQNPLTQV